MQRKVSVRRGSTAALDPHGVHSEVNLNPSRSSSSTLTIVRVQQVPNLNNDPRPGSPQRRIHRRVAPSTSPPPEPTNRLSFAFTSFSSNKDQPPSPSSSPRIQPSSPRLQPSPHARSGSFSGKPRLTPDQLVDLARQAINPKSLVQADPPAGISHSVTPATFTPLPEDIYLPFIDRPSEVAALISSPPNLRLFSLLAQTFPNNKPMVTDPSIELPSDPTQWSYPNLIHHLTLIDRDTAPDPIWAIAARKCIHSHSELIWERIKGALGVPPELCIDCDFSQENHQSSTLNINEGLDRDHWADWDSVMESPVVINKRLSFGSPVVDYDVSSDDILDHEGAALTLDRQSPPTITHQGPTLDDVTPDHLSIEPLLAIPPSASFSSLSNVTTGDGLDDIAEGAEEDETGSVSNTESTMDPGLVGQETKDPELISPSQIQGLRISTSPIPSFNSSFGTPPIMSPISPLPPYIPVGTTMCPPPSNSSGFSSSLPRSRTSSFSSIGPFQRPESMGSLAALRNAAAGNYASSVFTGSEPGDTRERDAGYVSDGDRPPGQPLFPSNFARLTIGRTK